MYLNELDQFVKRGLGCCYYLRYCDDFILLDESREQLGRWHSAIDCFLREKLRLELNLSQYRLCPVSSGIDFLGYVVRRKYVLVRRRVVSHLKERLDIFDRRLAECRREAHNETTSPWRSEIARRGGFLQHPEALCPEVGASPCGRSVASWRYPPATMEQFRATVNSYLGHMQWADSYRLVQSLFARYPVLRASFYLTGNKVTPRYIPSFTKGTLQRQNKWWSEKGMFYGRSEKRLVRAAHPTPVEEYEGMPADVGCAARTRDIPSILILFRVGLFYEMYNEQAETGTDLLGLKPVTGLHGFRKGCGFHYRYLGKYLDLARQHGFHVALLREEKDTIGRVYRRLARLFRACDNGASGAPYAAACPRIARLAQGAPCAPKHDIVVK